MIYFQKKMSNKIFLFLIAVFVILTMNSCSDVKKGLGLEKEIPNEFLIEKKAALILPPDYKMLPPDSQIKTRDAKKSNNSLKQILDSNSNNKKSLGEPNDNTSSDIEKEILKQIK